MINEILASQVIGQPTPVIGMGATYFSGSDRYAATVVEVIEKNGSFIVGIQDDNAKVTNPGSGGTGGEEYEFTANPNGRIQYFRAKTKDSRWEGVYKNEETGRWNKVGFGSMMIGKRDTYRDPHF